MRTDSFTFAAFGPEHMAGALRLSQAAGWPHRTEDWALLRNLSHGVVALGGDRLVATAMATPFGAGGTLNMIIVDEAMRGRGLGRRIMEEAMAQHRPDEWRLVATREGLPLYEKLGFAAYGEVEQFQGEVQLPDGAEKPAPAGAGTLDWAAQTDVGVLAALDRAATGMDRSSLVATLFQAGRILVLREDGTEDGQIVAFAAIRPFGRGEVAGPVVARSGEEAKRLLTVLLAERNGRFLRVDTATDTGLGPWLTDHGLAHAGGGISMRLGKAAPSSATHQTFALAAQALG